MLDATFNKHPRSAYQFSGGKDSLACLYHLESYWDRFTVYFCDSGDAIPETLAIVDKVRKQVPHFKLVKGRVVDTHARLGFPSDVVPASETPLAKLINEQRGERIIDAYTCCANSLWAPMHEAMLHDDITLIIRGQKTADFHKGPTRSGQSLSHFEFLYPIEGWTDEQVFTFLKQRNIELPKYYADGVITSIDCMHCTAWLGHGIQEYVQKHYPQSFRLVRDRLNKIAVAVEPCTAQLNKFKD